MKLYKYVHLLTCLFFLSSCAAGIGEPQNAISKTVVSSSSEEESDVDRAVDEEIGSTVEGAVQASVIGEPYIVGETIEEDLTEEITGLAKQSTYSSDDEILGSSDTCNTNEKTAKAVK